MPKIEILGQAEFDVAPGTNLLTFLQNQGYDTKLPASCDGEGMCSTCAARVVSGGGAPNANEVDVLSEEQIDNDWRLTCQVKVEEDTQILVPGYEPPEPIDIEADKLAGILNYAVANLNFRDIDSNQRITASRINDLAVRASAITAGEVEANDFSLLADVFTHVVHTPSALTAIEETFSFDEERLRSLLLAFEDRMPEEEEEILMYPYYMYIVASIGLFLMVALSAYALMVDAPLEEAATPSFTPNPEKAPWYFLGIQELLAISPNLGGPFTSVAVGGVIIPGVFVFLLVAMPYVERYLEFWRPDKSSPPGPRLRDRPVTATLFLILMAALIILIIIGVYFRGPGWEWVSPWQ